MLLTNVVAGAPEGVRIDAAVGECVRSDNNLKDLNAFDGLLYARREY